MTDLARLIPEKLHVKYLYEAKPDTPATPRFYTLTHSDSTGDLFLSIGPAYDKKQISGLYTRLMRDEVLAELKKDSDGFSLNIHCHVSGGFVFGRAKWRYNIFYSELSLALEAIRFGDKAFFDHDPKLDEISILVHFKSANKKYDKTEKWGTLEDYKL
ncbi:staygreen family protein [Candidatus Bathyarchaeota archaeon]|nr:staygreen family protein [Candidatus Bathyarchaeota archaeon]